MWFLNHSSIMEELADMVHKALTSVVKQRQAMIIAPV